MPQEDIPTKSNARKLQGDPDAAAFPRQDATPEAAPEDPAEKGKAFIRREVPKPSSQ